ncbi:MAG: hypothetical protein ACSHX8_04010 [Opitutaceae bacterium]
MISWIQNHLIRHGRWIFLSLLALIIVAFVFTIGNTPGCTTDRSAYVEDVFYGVDLNAPRERDVIIEKVQLSAYLNGQQASGQQVKGRVALLHLADEIGVPAPSQAALAEYIKTKRAFADADGQFSADAYTTFVDTVDSNPRMQSGLVGLVLEEDYRIDQLNTVMSGPGFSLPSEAKAQTQSSQTTLKLETATIAYSDFTPEVEGDEATLKAYYEANTARYEIPERIKASYVFFPSAKHLETVTIPTDAELRAHFIADRATFVDAYNATQPPVAEGEEAPAVTFENVRHAVEKSLRAANAAHAANEAAQAFAYGLYQNNIELESAAFNTLLNNSGLSLIEIEPYTQEGASQRALSADMLKSAFTLGGNRYYSDAYPVDNGYAVLIYQGRIAPEVPAFEAIQAEVSVNYLAEKKRELFNAKGEDLKAAIDTLLADGTPFSEAAESLGLKTTTYDAFKVAEAPRGLNRTVLQKAQGMTPGSVSPMLVANQVGTLIYLESKEVPEIANDSEDLAQAKQFLTYISAQVSSSSAVNELVALGSPEGSEEVADEE